MTRYDDFIFLITACQWALTLGIVLGFAAVFVKRLVHRGWSVTVARFLGGLSAAQNGSALLLLGYTLAVVGCGFCCEYFWDFLCWSF
jgi:hypothetical protein